MKPDWLEGTTHKDWLFDGYRCSEKQWESLDWSKAYVDMGPSVAGNLGPYWHVPHKDGDTVHRLYPKLLQTKWLLVVRQAVEEFAERQKALDGVVYLANETIIGGIRHDPGIYRRDLVRLDPKEIASF